jgi:hypothetical protein
MKFAAMRLQPTRRIPFYQLCPTNPTPRRGIAIEIHTSPPRDEAALAVFRTAADIEVLAVFRSAVIEKDKKLEGQAIDFELVEPIEDNNILIRP